MKLENLKSVYFIGIGGNGMSALAQYFKSRGVQVFGSDRDLESETVKKLKAEGFIIFDQNQIDSFPEGIDLVVKTLAIPEENLEWKMAEGQGVPIYNYAEVLGEISKNYFTIAVAGTHGKTTTTAMTYEVARNQDLDPTVIVGSFLNHCQRDQKVEENSTHQKIQTNFVNGESDLFIVEACEYGRSFLNLDPNILIITNLEADHLDYYKDLDDLKQAFYDLASKLPDDGKIVCNSNDINLKKIVEDFSNKVIDYSELVEQVRFKHIFGRHNQENGAAAITAIKSFFNDSSHDSDKYLDAIEGFAGTWRRMEYKGQLENGALVYDDYGHHPTEIRATIESFRNHFNDKKIAVVFGPHLHSRTKMFFDEFVESLSLADRVGIYPIFKARAEDDFGVSAEILVDAINNLNKNSDKKADKCNIAKFTPDFESIASEINKLDENWVVILMGAGEVYQVSDLINF